MSVFFAMNGYGFYIWSAYSVAALAVIIEIVALRIRRKAALDRARMTAPDVAIDSRAVAQ